MKIIIDKQGNILINEKEDKFTYCLLDYKYHSKDDNNLIITLKKDINYNIYHLIKNYNIS